MKLNELVGVKKYKDMQLPELITQVMNDNGFKKLGKGALGVAFKRQGDPYVYKLFVKDSCYQQFIEYAMKNPSKNFPRIYGFKSLSAFWKRPEINIDERLYIAKVEYITLAEQSQYENTGISNFIEEQLKYGSDLSTLDRAFQVDVDNGNIRIDSGVNVDVLAANAKEFIFVVAAMINALPKFCSIDIHGENYGYRENGDMVILDPAVDWNDYDVRNTYHPTDRVM
jgi:hypothetical protein